MTMPAGRIESLRGQVPPALFLKDPAVEFVVPEHLQGLALRIVVRASQTHDGRLIRCLGSNDLLDQPPSGPDLDQVPHFGNAFGWRSLLA